MCTKNALFNLLEKVKSQKLTVGGVKNCNFFQNSFPNHNLKFDKGELFPKDIQKFKVHCVVSFFVATELKLGNRTEKRYFRGNIGSFEAVILQVCNIKPRETLSKNVPVIGYAFIGKIFTDDKKILICNGPKLTKKMQFCY